MSTTCNHKNKAFRCFSYTVKDGNQRNHKVLQCLICGLRLKSDKGGLWWPADKGEKITDLENYDANLSETWNTARGEETKEQQHREMTLKHKEYEFYIQNSKDWQKRRSLVMWRCRGLCEACLIKPAVQVHHLNYDSLFHEVMWDLKGVCRECHEKIHGIY